MSLNVLQVIASQVIFFQFLKHIVLEYLGSL